MKIEDILDLNGWSRGPDILPLMIVAVNNIYRYRKNIYNLVYYSVVCLHFRNKIEIRS